MIFIVRLYALSGRTAEAIHRKGTEKHLQDNSGVCVSTKFLPKSPITFSQKGEGILARKRLMYS